MKTLLILTIIEDPGVASIDLPGVILKPIKLADVSSLEPTAKFETKHCLRVNVNAMSLTWMLCLTVTTHGHIAWTKNLHAARLDDPGVRVAPPERNSEAGVPTASSNNWIAIESQGVYGVHFARERVVTCYVFNYNNHIWYILSVSIDDSSPKCAY